MTLLERIRWENALSPGDPVEVRWGYGLGFRAHGQGVVDRIYRQSVRVRLTEPVGPPSGTTDWPEGFVLKGIPRAQSLNSNEVHGIFPPEVRS